MRMKLSHNYDYNTHDDASQLRDQGSTPVPEPQQADTSLLLAKVRCYIHLPATCTKEVASFPGPAQLSVAISTVKRGSVLQATKSWAGPGNEATSYLYRGRVGTFVPSLSASV